VLLVFRRLADWPNVSGAKPLRGNLKGNFRIRTGDYRVVFKPSPDNQVVTVWKIGHRGGIYD
jgi:mRNA-degrading endonuclease RelE of RelBE toxin-antitoxin system